MATDTQEINLEVFDFFKSKFPDLKIKHPKWASLGITQEFRKMDIGDIVLFPIDRYNYSSIRTTPGTTMVPETINEGRKWKVRIDKPNRSAAVLRVS